MTAKNLDSDKCIMVIGAHAADAEIMGGATVLKHVDAGWRAVMVHMTPGEKGHPKLSPVEYKTIKDVEAVLAKHNVQVKRIDHPRATLEELFLKTVEESQARPGQRYIPPAAKS